MKSQTNVEVKTKKTAVSSPDENGSRNIYSIPL